MSKSLETRLERLSATWPLGAVTRDSGTIAWTITHNSRFEYSKIALIDFAHHSNETEHKLLILPNTTINPTKSTKYLGVILDQSLNWKQQLAYVIGKGTTWAAQIKRAARPTWGLMPKSARKLYLGVALPRILYRIKVWCHQKHRRKNQTPATAMRKLASVQRQGALAITGGFRTSLNNALDAYASLLPMHLRLEKVKFNTATHIASLPPTHPLHKPIRKAVKRQVKRHCSPLHELASSLSSAPEELETVPVVHNNPVHHQSTSLIIHIPADKEASKRVEAHTREEIKVYTDGLSHNSAVGAAVVMYRNGRHTCTLKYHLGPASKHTVYEAKLVGLLLGLHLIKTEKRSNTSCALGADNQAAIEALQSELTRPGQHIAVEFVKTANTLRKTRSKRKYKLTVRWTAGHVGIAGNEKADTEAKTAVEGTSSDKTDLPRYLRKAVRSSISASKQKHNEKLNETWKVEWQRSDRYKRFKAPDIISPASKKFLLLTNDHRISRHMASLIFQLRVSHARLNGYLN